MVIIDSPILQTQYFIYTFFIILFLSMRKKQPSQEGLSFEVSEELKGFAILSIVFSHIGYFLVNDHSFLFPLSVLAGVGVDLFLLLSGYGLTISALKKPLTLVSFYKKRLFKLILPLWITFTAFILLDKFILGINYSYITLINNYLGFFPAADISQGINSPLWYISFILFYYLLFPILFKKELPLGFPLLALLAGFLYVNQELPIKEDLIKLYKIHFIAFPIGSLIAVISNYSFNKNIIISTLDFDHWYIRYPLLLISGYFIYHLAIYSGVGKGLKLEQAISLISVMFILLFFILKPLSFKLFSLFGKYSYEIYLIHWPILLRYDHIFPNFPGALAVITYLILFIILGIILQLLTNKFSAKLIKD
jgi:peptidoglycan/LPS O-acetylase OafA/YrhL